MTYTRSCDYFFPRYYNCSLYWLMFTRDANQKDRERAVYGLKEKNLAKTYIKLIPLGMRDPDAIRLLNWKKPTERGATSGDFPTVLYEVVSKRSSVIEGSLSIDDLNDILDELAKNMGKQWVSFIHRWALCLICGQRYSIQDPATCL
jgi:hypothetical protein